MHFNTAQPILTKFGGDRHRVMEKCIGYIARAARVRDGRAQRAKVILRGVWGDSSGRVYLRATGGCLIRAQHVFTKKRWCRHSPGQGELHRLYNDGYDN